MDNPEEAARLNREFREVIDAQDIPDDERKFYLDDLTKTMETLRHRKD
jgi:hypothetical protein